VNLSWRFLGVEYPLDDGNLSWHIGNSGFGMAPFQRFESRGPQQHGSTDEGYLLQPRIISVAAAVHGDDWPDLFVKRSELLQIFKPTRIPGTLRWQLGGIVRDIDAFLIGGLEFVTEERIGLIQKYGIQLKANDPTWYDPSAVTVTWAMDAAGGGTPVPTPIPTPVGASSIGASQVINYLGSAPSFPHLIRIEGPVVSPVIEHLGTGLKLDFTGTILGAGEYLILDLTWDNKTVVDNTSANRIDSLTRDSDLSKFAILPSPDVSGGINEIMVTGSGTNSLTRLDMVFYTRFVGL